MRIYNVTQNRKIDRQRRMNQKEHAENIEEF